MKILGFGDATCDVDLDSRMMYPGGQALNVAVNARLCGAQAAFMGCLGNDTVAEHIVAAMDSLNIEHLHARRYPVPHERALYRLINGERNFVSPDASGMSPLTRAMRSMLVYEGLSSGDLLYMDSFDIIHTSEVSRVERLLPRIKSINPLLSFDLSLAYTDRSYFEYVCSFADFVLLSASQIAEKDARYFLRRASALGVRLAIATRGAKPALCWDGSALYSQIPMPVENMLDTMGAGDAFFGAFLCRYLSLNPNLQAEMNPQSIRCALHYAASHAASICSQRGSFGFGTPCPQSVVVQGFFSCPQ